MCKESVYFPALERWHNKNVSKLFITSKLEQVAWGSLSQYSITPALIPQVLYVLSTLGLLDGFFWIFFIFLLFALYFQTNQMEQDFNQYWFIIPRLSTRPKLVRKATTWSPLFCCTGKLLECCQVTSKLKHGNQNGPRQERSADLTSSNQSPDSLKCH